MGTQREVAVVGASSFVGLRLLQLLVGTGWAPTAWSRQRIPEQANGVRWLRLPGRTATPIDPNEPLSDFRCANWIFLAPLWVLPDYFDALLASGARRVVALSSTSRFSKSESSDAAERAIAQRLADAEASATDWAARSGVELVIVRPTLIYGDGRDRNITEIARFIRRFGFFPLFGKGGGRRQPVHAKDVAQACAAALIASEAAGRSYILSGGETLTYREMVQRVFQALGRRPRFLPIPLWAFRLAIAVLHVHPRYRNWTPEMAERMNRDLVFEHSEARRDLGFDPCGFHPEPDELLV